MQVARIFEFLLLSLVYIVGTHGQTQKGLARDDIQGGRFIREFGDESIKSTLEQAKFSFIYFYSDACKFCAQFEPEFDFLSHLYNNQTDVEEDEIQKESKLQILKTNALSNKRLSDLFKIQRYPTLKLLDFNTKEIIPYDKPDRSIDSLIKFIGEHVADVSPNFANVESSVHLISSPDQLDTLAHDRDTVVVFTADYLIDWDRYDYPTHFYQKLSNAYSNTLHFCLVDTTAEHSSSVIAKYRVSNFPAVIYINKSTGAIKTFNTASQNHHTNKKLSEEDIISFLHNINNDEPQFGNTFNDVAALQSHTDQHVQTYQGHKFVRGGFNYRQQDVSRENVDIEDEYDQLVHSIGL